jgi:hypothetical protein
MSRVSKPRCARGDNCYHVLRTGSERPPTVSSEGDLCHKCRQQGFTLEDVPEEHKELLRAADALLECKITGERAIIPTLVLAAFSSTAMAYGRLRARIVDSHGDDKAWAVLNRHFAMSSTSGIQPFDVVAPKLGSGLVPIVHYSPVECVYEKEDDYEIATNDLGDAVSRVIVIVHERVKPEQVGHSYQEALKLRGFSTTTAKYIHFAVEASGEALRMVVHPGTSKAAFPDPTYVAAAYEAYKAQGFGPPGRQGGSGPAASRLVAAVVAWYLDGRHARQKRPDQTKNETARLISEYLLEPRGWGQEKVLKDLSRTLKAARPEIERAEGDLSQLLLPGARISRDVRADL